MKTPKLPHYCGSWVIVDRTTKQAVLEVFKDNARVLRHINTEAYEILTALQYLSGLNNGDLKQ